MANQNPAPNTANLDGLVRAASEIASGRTRTMTKLRDALKTGDDKKALALARELCGMYDEPPSKPKPS